MSIIVCTNRESIVYSEVVKYGSTLEKITILNDDLLDETKKTWLIKLRLDYIILAWWPYIINAPILSVPKFGIINFHPSLLPFNKGKNYNFWTIIENTPFGVSLHFIDDSIDGGDIIFQSPIFQSWLDTGQTLYLKAQEEMIKLFVNSYEKIRMGHYKRIPQVKNEGSFHFGSELNLASRIELGKKYEAKELLNILRAKTFPPHPGAWFEDNGERYEINISIKKQIL